MSQPLLAVHDLVLGAFAGASPVTFTVGPGERWLIVGEAGSGKTSLAKSLMGIISIASGRIALFGKSLEELKPDQLLYWRRHAAAIFSSDGLMPAWTGLDNLALPLRLAGASDGNAIEQHIREWTAGYEIPAAWLDAICITLSRDARLTLALARALIKRPGLLILDSVPIDNALAYRRPAGLAMLDDFVRRGGSLLVLVREAYADRYAETALPSGFRRARLETGQLHFERELPADGAASTPASPFPQPPSHG